MYAQYLNTGDNQTHFIETTKKYTLSKPRSSQPQILVHYYLIQCN